MKKKFKLVISDEMLGKILPDFDEGKIVQIEVPLNEVDCKIQSLLLDTKSTIEIACHTPEKEDKGLIGYIFRVDKTSKNTVILNISRESRIQKSVMYGLKYLILSFCVLFTGYTLLSRIILPEIAELVVCLSYIVYILSDILVLNITYRVDTSDWLALNEVKQIEEEKL